MRAWPRSSIAERVLPCADTSGGAAAQNFTRCKTQEKPSAAIDANALAQLLGVSERSIRDLAKRGIVVKAKRGLYDLAPSVRAYCTHLREMAAARSGSTTLTNERVRLAKEQADSQALKNAQHRRELVDVAAIEQEWTEILRDVRAGLLALQEIQPPHRLTTFHCLLDLCR